MKTICVKKSFLKRWDRTGGFLWKDKSGQWHTTTAKLPPSTASYVAWYKEMRRQFSEENLKRWNVIRVKACS